MSERENAAQGLQPQAVVFAEGMRQAAIVIGERLRVDFERIYTEEAPTMTDSERQLARKFVDSIASLAREIASDQPAAGPPDSVSALTGKEGLEAPTRGVTDPLYLALDGLQDTLRGLAVSAVNGDYNAEKMCERLIEEANKLCHLLDAYDAASERPRAAPMKDPAESGTLEGARAKFSLTQLRRIEQATDALDAALSGTASASSPPASPEGTENTQRAAAQAVQPRGYYVGKSGTIGCHPGSCPVPGTHTITACNYFRAELARYGQHLPGCTIGARDCSCGLLQALDARPLASTSVKPPAGPPASSASVSREGKEKKQETNQQAGETPAPPEKR